MLIRPLLVTALALTAACDRSEPEAPPTNTIMAPADEPGPPPPEAEPAPAPPPKAEPTPEADAGERDAAAVLRDYYDRIEAGDYAGAWTLRTPSAGDDAGGFEAFAASFDRYAVYRANVGEPGRVEGAAGSLYVEVPVQIYGRMKDGTPFSSAGTVTLRRANNVPGSTAAERQWRIYARD